MSTEAIALLKSIDASLKALLRQQMAPAGTSGAVASDRDLDSKYGDPEVKAKDPRDWTGPSMRGRRFSECPPEYLDMVAERLDYFAEQADLEDKKTANGKPVSHYNRLDAARARGWAERIRSGRHVQTTPSEATDSGWAGAPGATPAGADDDIPY